MLTYRARGHIRPHGGNSGKCTSLAAIRKRVKRMIVSSVVGQTATKQSACLGRSTKDPHRLVGRGQQQAHSVGLFERIEVRRGVTLLEHLVGLCVHNNLLCANNENKGGVMKHSGQPQCTIDKHVRKRHHRNRREDASNHKVITAIVAE